MNLIAIDIGNRNIKIALYIKDTEKLLKTACETAGDIEKQLIDILTECWDQVPLVESAKEPVKDCVVVTSSVKPEWTERLREIVKDELGAKLLVIGQDVPLPLDTAAQARPSLRLVSHLRRCPPGRA